MESVGHHLWYVAYDDGVGWMDDLEVPFVQSSALFLKDSENINIVASSIFKISSTASSNNEALTIIQNSSMLEKNESEGADMLMIIQK